MHPLIRHNMIRQGQKPVDLDDKSRFLKDFTASGELKRLTEIDLASRNRPKPRLRLLNPLAKQKPPRIHNKGPTPYADIVFSSFHMPLRVKKLAFV